MSGKVSDLTWMQPNTTLESTAVLFLNFPYVEWQHFKRQTIVELHWLECVCFVSARPSGQSPCPRSSLALSTFMATGERAKKFSSAAAKSYLDRGLDSCLATEGYLCGHSEATRVYLWLWSCCLFPRNKFSPKLQFARRLQDLVASRCICFTLCSHPWQGQLRRSVPAD